MRHGLLLRMRHASGNTSSTPTANKAEAVTAKLKAFSVKLPYIKVRKREASLMSTVTRTSSGQITIPVDVRNDLKVDARDRVEFVLIAPGRYEFVAAASDVTALRAGRCQLS